jgi:hypothetical protein
MCGAIFRKDTISTTFSFGLTSFSFARSGTDSKPGSRLSTAGAGAASITTAAATGAGGEGETAALSVMREKTAASRGRGDGGCGCSRGTTTSSFLRRRSSSMMRRNLPGTFIPPAGWTKKKKEKTLEIVVSAPQNNFIYTRIRLIFVLSCHVKVKITVFVSSNLGAFKSSLMELAYGFFLPFSCINLHATE